MTRSVALIRGVGGATAMKMAELTAAVTAAGLGDVATLQVAGNIVFNDSGHDSAYWAQLVHDAVLSQFGHDLAVLVRTHRQLVDLVARHRFAGTQEGKWLMTVVLDAQPTPERIASIDPTFGSPDQFVIDGAEIFIRYDGGVAGSKLQTAAFERQLGVVGTARNSNTLAKLVAMTA